MEYYITVIISWYFIGFTSMAIGYAGRLRQQKRYTLRSREKVDILVSSLLGPIALILVYAVIRYIPQD